MGPFLFSLRKGKINTLHPQFIIPFYMVYFILNSFIQDSTNWMNEGNRAIIVGLVKLLPELSVYNFSFEKTLFISLISGIFFHIGSLVFNKSIYNSNHEHVFLDKKTIVHGRKKNVILTSVIICSVCWLPYYFLSHLGGGTFWTYSLALSSAFIPVALFSINRFIFFITLLFALLIATILKSKASYVYTFLPIIFYYIFFHFDFLKIFIKKKYLTSAIISFIIFIIIIIFLNIGNLGAKRLFHRDYAFEIFAILVESKELGLIQSQKSWIKNEVLEIVPSILYKEKFTTHINPAKRVAIELFPETAKDRSGTYWNRHLLFAGYYDFGFIGSLISAFIYGLFFSYLWRVTKQKVKEYNAKWPIFVYLPLPTFGAYFLAVGGLNYGLINMTIASIILYLIFFTARIKLS